MQNENFICTRKVPVDKRRFLGKLSRSAAVAVDSLNYLHNIYINEIDILTQRTFVLVGHHLSNDIAHGVQGKQTDQQQKKKTS